MTTVAVALVAPDASRAGVETAIAHLSPSYTVSLAVPVCAIAGNVTWQTPATHWYANGASVDQDIASAWQAAATGSLPQGYQLPPDATMTEQDILDAMSGIPVWTGANVTDATAWAAANLGPEGLMQVPSNPDP